VGWGVGVLWWELSSVRGWCGGCRAGVPGVGVVFENWTVERVTIVARIFARPPGVGGGWWCSCAMSEFLVIVFFGLVCGVLGRPGGWVVQVGKGARWMPGHQEPMKDVGGCVKPRGAVNRALIRGCPNGGTRQQSCAVTRA
jgi:hypothetical protein